ncbi:hypothetical protein [Paracidovorax valerianellae]|uniref:Lipoprotein n=1 Tax=Paracidovorax valerianellae TaxID=187868 RepID=A0A1G6YYX4_9BURK|nr:hypothetical protein [Paracidovorax valerianellae]MDA8447319.1 hypothetical protein [Paracidovorax valerianellae]SDD94756.1 hypothetical protein SAMN05192589_110182 [Paracidovorax valerianellae]
MVFRYVLLVLLNCALIACSSNQEPKMNSAASALTKLTAHVDAAVVYGTGTKELSDQQLVDMAFEDNSSLKPELGSNAISLQRGDRGVVVLVCSSDRATSLLEDLSCTPEMDKHHWREEPGRTCTFSLSAESCK